MTHLPLDRRQFLRSALVAGCALRLSDARAEPGGVIFGFAPGSGVLPVVAAVQHELQGRYLPDLGVKIVYLVGNVGARAVEAVQKAAADGGTVLLAPSDVLTLLPVWSKPQGGDPALDLLPVAALADMCFVFAVGLNVPQQVRTLKDYGLWVRQNPTQANYGVPGIGTAAHLMGMALARAVDLPLKPVPYKGGFPMLQDMVEGGLPAAFVTMGTGTELFRSGQLRRLAVTSPQRWPGLPEVPTTRESGLSDISATGSYGFFLPARTPPAKVQELRAAVALAVRGAAVSTAVANVQMRAIADGAEDYAAVITRERAAWADIVRAHRFSIDH